MTDNFKPHTIPPGVKLADILKELIENLGWEEMENETGIRCFGNNPTFKSSLKFLRTTPWARTKTESLYLDWLVYKKINKL